jgi:hypothetical protein
MFKSKENSSILIDQSNPQYIRYMKISLIKISALTLFAALMVMNAFSQKTLDILF